MSGNSNIVGQNVAKFRYQRGWTQDELVGKLQLEGCYMTRDILANIETRRCVVTEHQLLAFAVVFKFENPFGILPPDWKIRFRQIRSEAPLIIRRRRRKRRAPKSKLDSTAD